jgi:hypothetical protein
MTGIAPSSLRRALRSYPATVQEKWYARLYLLKPVVFTAFSLFWIATAFMSLGPGWDIGIGLLNGGGITGGPAAATVIAGALADLIIGIGIAFRRTARPALYAAFALSLAYAVTGTVLVPRLWADPLGPMLKIWPVLALNLVALAILVLKYLHVIGAAVLLGTGAGIAFFMLVGHFTDKPALVAGIARRRHCRFSFHGKRRCHSAHHGRCTRLAPGLVAVGRLASSFHRAVPPDRPFLAAGRVDADALARLSGGGSKQRRASAACISSPVLVVVRLRLSGLCSRARHLLADDCQADVRHTLARGSRAKEPHGSPGHLLANSRECIHGPFHQRYRNVR